MARFRTDFKDEIPSGGTRKYNLLDGNGAYIGKNVKLMRSNSNQQEGDTFSADEVNAIHKFLNGLLSGNETVKKAENADKVCGFGIKNSATTGQPIYVPGFNGGVPIDMLMYDTRTWNVRSADYFHDTVYSESKSIVVNPGGNDYIDISLSKRSNFFVASAVNGDIGAFPGCVKCCQAVSSTKFRIVLEYVFSSPVRINYKVDWFN